ncbi:hypothetical protein AAFF_G00178650 [Aldrovandia affinis]|uniref:Uncharacterized protein n=1 Tax=Aldrovandia affinis TaxID=143900 RepID=A0AAD7W775_9TELE|nr:hypothetical protein AAFF_G00178650 [Aldrovandia affinis]
MFVPGPSPTRGRAFLYSSPRRMNGGESPSAEWNRAAENEGAGKRSDTLCEGHVTRRERTRRYRLRWVQRACSGRLESNLSRREMRMCIELDV